MNHGIKTTGLPDLTANLLRDGGCLIDNLFADTPENNIVRGQVAGAGGGYGVVNATASLNFGHMSMMVSDKPSVQEAQYIAHIIIVVYKMRMKARKQTMGHPIDNLERLAAELRKIRRGRKVSQQELSDRAMVARRTITNAEGAENVGVKELCRIANGLGYELVLRPKDTVVFEELSTTFKDEE